MFFHFHESTLFICRTNPVDSNCPYESTLLVRWTDTVGSKKQRYRGRRGFCFFGVQREWGKDLWAAVLWKSRLHAANLWVWEGFVHFFQFSWRKAFASFDGGGRIAIPAERGWVVMRPAGRSQNNIFVIGFFVATNQGFWSLKMIFLENRLQYQQIGLKAQRQRKRTKLCAAHHQDCLRCADEDGG